VRRYAQIINLKPGASAEYDRLHAAVWPDVLATICRCNIRNYSIFRLDSALFAYFEYTGDDFAADMARMAADSATQAWWKLTEPLQLPHDDRPPGAWWMPLVEVFHTD
jgi:L-rhamnose mutarotase